MDKFIVWAQARWKGIIAFGGAAIATTITALNDGFDASVDTGVIATAWVTAVLVYLKRNQPPEGTDPKPAPEGG